MNIERSHEIKETGLPRPEVVHRRLIRMESKLAVSIVYKLTIDHSGRSTDSSSNGPVELAQFLVGSTMLEIGLHKQFGSTADAF